MAMAKYFFLNDSRFGDVIMVTGYFFPRTFLMFHLARVTVHKMAPSEVDDATVVIRPT